MNLPERLSDRPQLKYIPEIDWSETDEGFKTSLKSWQGSKAFAGVARAALLALACGAIAIDGAAAQPYPARSIKIISPFSPGGPPDALGRLVGQKLSERFGWNVAVENRPGAGTTLATRAAATADPDGYTLLQVNATLVYAPVLYPDPGYDPVKSFAPVATLATWSHLLVVPADVPANTVAELIAFAKANPDKANIAYPARNASSGARRDFQDCVRRAVQQLFLIGSSRSSGRICWQDGFRPTSAPGLTWSRWFSRDN